MSDCFSFILYNQKLEMLAKMAQPEKWTYKKIQDIDPYRILRNYIQFTYNRLDEENKFISSSDGKFRCMNTGLLTVYNQEIIAIFAQNERGGKLPWFFNGFLRKLINFSQLIFHHYLLWLIIVITSKI